MAIPAGKADSILAQDKKYREIDLVTRCFPFSVLAPGVASTIALLSINYNDPSVIERAILNLASDSPGGGIMALFLSKTNNPALLSGGSVSNGQMITPLWSTGEAQNSTERFFPDILYVDKDQTLYLFLTQEGFAAGKKLKGALTLHTLPTYR